MNQQMTLFPEQDKKLSIKKRVISDKSIDYEYVYTDKEEETNQDSGKLGQFHKKCIKNKKNRFVIFIKYRCIKDKMGYIKHEGVNIDSSIERIFKDECDSFGGSYGLLNDIDSSSTKEEAKKIVESILEEKKEHCNYGYIEKGYGLYTKDIHWEYMKLIITDNAKNFLSNLIDVKKFISDWDNIKGHYATEEERMRETKYNDFEAEEKLLGEEIQEIESILKHRCGLEPEYFSSNSKGKKQYNSNWINMKLEDLIKKKTAKKERKKYVEKETYYMRFRGYPNA
ncbi:MAG: hypothetical protein GY830_07755 [Bacteroidetes bacterium]|nr:hypothetical protein [Bacteroidota bacterium]